MADNIFSAFGGFGGAQQIIIYVGYFILFIIIAAIITALVIFIVVNAKKKVIFEITMINRRVRKLTGRERKNKAGRLQLWVGKLKKFLPKLQDADVFLQGKKDIVFMLKDNNGLYHTLRLPTMAQIKLWYKAVHNIDLDEKMKEAEDEIKAEKGAAGEKETVDDSGEEQKRTILERIRDKFMGGTIADNALDLIGTLYMLPNPSEDLNWLAEQCVEADKSFIAEWWKSPAFIWGTALFVSAIVFIMTMIISKKM